MSEKLDSQTMGELPATMALKSEQLAAVEDSSGHMGEPLIAERYEVLGMLGAGGMGNVYKVLDTALDEVIALKTLRRELISSPGAMARFRREVKLARRVTHPSVARTYDLGTDGDIPYLTMEFIDGEPLHVHVQRCGGIHRKRASELIIAIAEGLGAAHDAGVVHRDLKPANIMVSGERLVITDFGIARAQHTDHASPTTIDGLVGTPTYMAPEQIQGEQTLDHRADLYALGVIFYELLAGQPPFVADTPVRIALSRLTQDPPPLPKTGGFPELDAIVMRLLARHPDDRFADVAELTNALRDASEQRSYDSGTLVAPKTKPMSNALGRRRSGRTRVAVLPFTERGGSGTDDYIANGLAEELIDELSMTRELMVKPLSAVISLGDVAGGSPAEVGELLGVDVVVSGSIRRQGDALKIRVALVSVDEGFQIWGSKCTGALADVFSIAEDAAASIAQALATEQGHDVRPAASSDPGVIELYMRGRQQLQHMWFDGVDLAITYFEQALERVPEDARVLTGAATARARAVFFEPKGAMMHLNLAREYARRAVDAAPQWAEPYYAHAITAYNAQDWGSVMEYARRALERDPDFTDAHELLGRILVELGPLEDALEHFERVMSYNEHLYTARWDAARAHALLGDFEAMEALCDKPVYDANHIPIRAVTRLRLRSWHVGMELMSYEDFEELSGNGRFQDVMFIAQRLFTQRALTPEDFESMKTAANRFPAGSQSRLLRLQTLAELAICVGAQERALELTTRAVDEGLRDLMWLEHCPLLREVASDPRLHTLRERMRQRTALIQGVSGSFGF
ncbi:MAG: protein kinase [Myxococcota bacterium]